MAMAESHQEQDTSRALTSAGIADDGTPSGGLVSASDGAEGETGANPTSGAAGAAAAPTISTSARSEPASEEAQKEESSGLSAPGLSNRGIPADNALGERPTGAADLPGSDATGGKAYSLGSLADPGAKSGGSSEAPSILTDPRAGTEKPN